ncbi:MAG: hypothetical protein HY293_22035 [Planctomycetes bacterium]|nr:hypothetical protein [Planctomycetota bacterium]
MRLRLSPLLFLLLGCAPAETPLEVRLLPRIGGRQSAILYYELDLATGSVAELASAPPGVSFPSYETSSPEELGAKIEPRLQEDVKEGDGVDHNHWSAALRSCELWASSSWIRGEDFRPKLHAVDLETRQFRWSLDSGPLAQASVNWPCWVVQPDESCFYLKSKEQLIKADPKTGRVLWSRPASGQSRCLLQKDRLLDPWIEVEQPQDFNTVTTVKIVVRDPATGVCRSTLPLRHFEGFHDMVIVAMALRGDLLQLRLQFIVHD